MKKRKHTTHLFPGDEEPVAIVRLSLLGELRDIVRHHRQVSLDKSRRIPEDPMPGNDDSMFYHRGEAASYLEIERLLQSVIEGR